MRFYQNYPPLKLKGERGCITRYHTYGLKELINPDSTVLDVGGNVGFFALYLSQYAKHIDIVEYDKSCIEVFSLVKNHENIQNVVAYHADFKKWTTESRYDFIMSLAVHKWINMPMRLYFQKLVGLLKPNGGILIESHPGDDGPALETAIKDNSDLVRIVSEGLSDDHVPGGFIHDHSGVPRKFFVLKPSQ
ncbi:MAG: class I SAM-dependent methyltransferase [Candidatus Woesearchaeota archaeon]